LGSKLRHQPLVEIGVPDDPLGPGQIGCVPSGCERSLDFCEVEAGAILDRPADQQPVCSLIGDRPSRIDSGSGDAIQHGGREV
jgi:hypothetical protein